MVPIYMARGLADGGQTAPRHNGHCAGSSGPAAARAAPLAPRAYGPLAI